MRARWPATKGAHLDGCCGKEKEEQRNKVSSGSADADKTRQAEAAKVARQDYQLDETTEAELSGVAWPSVVRLRAHRTRKDMARIGGKNHVLQIKI